MAEDTDMKVDAQPPLDERKLEYIHTPSGVEARTPSTVRRHLP